MASSSQSAISQAGEKRVQPTHRRSPNPYAKGTVSDRRRVKATGPSQKQRPRVFPIALPATILTHCRSSQNALWGMHANLEISCRIPGGDGHRTRPCYAFMNPIATVISSEPTKQFFRTVRKRQSEWCQRSRTTFGRRSTRRTKNWVMPEGSSSKHDRFLQRSLCFIGILFVDGSIVPPHEWSQIESAT